MVWHPIGIVASLTLLARASSSAVVPSSQDLLHSRRPTSRSPPQTILMMADSSSSNGDTAATKTSTPIASVGEETSASSRAIDFLTLTRNLKTSKRTGWVRSGVSQPESIADHMYRMSLMAMIASRTDERLNVNRCIQLALIHDLAEAKVGDITPYCGVSDADKHALELTAMEKIRDMLGPAWGGDVFLELWQEYEAGQTLESKLLKDLDKIEMILQAQEYEVEGNHVQSLDGFFDSTAGNWKTDIGKEWAAEIVSRRRNGGIDEVGKQDKDVGNSEDP